MSCDCYTIGGPFIAEDPDCPEHGWEAQKERERHEINLEGLNQRIRFLEAAWDALRADAERYRWLRDAGFYELPYDNHGAGPEFAVGDELDRQIDAAIAAKEPANGQG